MPLEPAGIWGENIDLPGDEGGLPVGPKPVDPWYFTSLEIPVESGRGIEQRDRADAQPVVVINQEAARHLSSDLGAANPVGRTVRIPMPGYGPDPGDHGGGSDRGRDPERAHGWTAGAGTAGRRPCRWPRCPSRTSNCWCAHRLSPRQSCPAFGRPSDNWIPICPWRTSGRWSRCGSRAWSGPGSPLGRSGAFAGLAALLAALGLYGVLAHAVAQQRREIGIRMALGARSADVLSHVLGNGVRMIAVGLVLGLAGAFALTRLLQSLLFETSALDPLALGIACVLMMLAGLLAAWIPANRAAHVDPMQGPP